MTSPPTTPSPAAGAAGPGGGAGSADPVGAADGLGGPSAPASPTAPVEQAVPAPPRATPQVKAFAAFRERNFALMWTASLLSSTGTWLQNVAVPFVILQITGSGAWLGVAGFLSTLPMVVFGPLAGSVADRFHRRDVLLIGGIAQGLLTFVLWLTWAAGIRNVWLLIALVTASSSVAGVTVASWQAFVTELVPRELLLNAVTLNSAQFNAARAFGPAFGGLVLATLGAGWAFFFNSVSFLFMVGGLLLVKVRRIERPPSEGRPRALAEMRSALRYVRHERGIVAALVVVFALGLLGGPLFNLLVVFVERVYRVGDGAYGILASCLGVGAIAAAPVIAGWGSRQRRSRMVTLAMVSYGLALLVVGAAPVYPLAAAGLLVAGAGYLGISSTLNTVMQLQVTEAMRGRVIALYVMSLTLAMPIGALVQGALVDVIGPQWTVAGAGAIFLAVFAALRFGTDLFGHMDDLTSADTDAAGGREEADDEVRLGAAEADAYEAAVDPR